MGKYSIIADLHNHTLSTDHAYSSITDIAEEAVSKRIRAFALTDHGPALPDHPNDWHFGCYHNVPHYIKGIRVLSGVEANVIDHAGRLDLDNATLSGLNVVIVSIHSCATEIQGREQCDSAMLAIAENPYVDIIGHSGTPEYAFDYERIIPLIGAEGKAIEINENTFNVRSASIANCTKIAKICKKHKVPIAVNSDSHYHGQMGVTWQCFKMLEEIDFPAELIINAGTESFNRFFRRKNITIY